MLNLRRLNSYTFHINLYDLAFLGAVFIGLTFALLLWFSKTVNRSANRFLALALVTMILWMMRILAIDIRLDTFVTRWDWLPMQFLLALGPLIYFYVLKITRPQYKLRRKDLLHFAPILLEQAVFGLEIKETVKSRTTIIDQNWNLEFLATAMNETSKSDWIYIGISPHKWKMQMELRL